MYCTAPYTVYAKDGGAIVAHNTRTGYGALYIVRTRCATILLIPEPAPWKVFPEVFSRLFSLLLEYVLLYVLSMECVLCVCVFQETPASRDPGIRPPPSRPVHLSLVSLSPSFCTQIIPAKKRKKKFGRLSLDISNIDHQGGLELHLGDLRSPRRCNA